MSDLRIDHAAIDRLIHEPVRLGIMTVLAPGYAADFTYLKQALHLSDGNLATHLRTLEEAGYVACSKEFLGRKPRTSYTATPKGQAALDEYRRVMAAMLNPEPAVPEPEKKDGQ